MHVEFVTSNEGRRANIYYAYEKIKKQETKKNTLDFPPLFSNQIFKLSDNIRK